MRFEAKSSDFELTLGVPEPKSVALLAAFLALFTIIVLLRTGKKS